MNPRAVATALCAVGNVAGTRRPTEAWLQDDFKGLSQLWAATANFTGIVLDAALLYGIRLLLLLCNCRHAHAQQF